MKNKAFIIAEIGNNHEGNFQTALKLIDQAKKCNVDAVKFQTFVPELFIDKNHSRYNFYKSVQLPFEDFEKLSIYAKKKKIEFFSTPLDIKSAIFLNKIQKMFKIASSDINFFPLIETIANFKKKIIFSTGVSNIDEIKTSKNYINKIWKKKNYRGKLSILHCVSEYPADIRKINLLTINYLKKKFPDCDIGFSDHTVGMQAAIYARNLGAKIIEKHFTLSNNFSSFRDHKIALNPRDMSTLVEKIRELELILGVNQKRMYRSEIKNKKIIRRKIYINKDIHKNKIIKTQDTEFIRSNVGMSIENINEVIGKKVNKQILREGMFTKKKLHLIEV